MLQWLEHLPLILISMLLDVHKKYFWSRKIIQEPQNIFRQLSELDQYHLFCIKARHSGKKSIEWRLTQNIKAIHAISYHFCSMQYTNCVRGSLRQFFTMLPGWQRFRNCALFSFLSCRRRTRTPTFLASILLQLSLFLWSTKFVFLFFFSHVPGVPSPPIHATIHMHNIRKILQTHTSSSPRDPTMRFLLRALYYISDN